MIRVMLTKPAFNKGGKCFAKDKCQWYPCERDIAIVRLC